MAPRPSTAYMAGLSVTCCSTTSSAVHTAHSSAALRRRSESCDITVIDELDGPATRRARASTSDTPHSGWTVVSSTSQHMRLYVSNRAIVHI